MKIPYIVGFLVLVMAAGVSETLAGTLIAKESQWRYWPGDDAPSEAAVAWAQPAFSDSRWGVGSSPFRYGDGAGGTLITGMQNSYSTFFLRRAFTVSSVSLVEGLELNMDYDDGFVVWLNGFEVIRANAPASLALNGFAPANHESGTFETFSLDQAVSRLVDGENVIAIQGFNTNLPSSDFMLHPELNFRGLDLAAPTVAIVDPPPGPVGAFSTVSITFSEPVRGVDARDLVLNGVSATRVRGSGDSYLFTFSRPEPGELTLRWSQDAGIQDLAANPNLFVWNAPPETRLYRLIDENAPFVTRVFPLPNQSLREFSAVEVSFSEPVSGLDASDLLVNGEGALSVEGVGAGPYRFTFPSLSSGSLTLDWAAKNGIEDSAAEPNGLQETSWKYQVDPQVTYGGVVISELMAGNQSGIFDDERDRVDWIELHNTTDVAVDLSGWSLSDNAVDPGKWVIGDIQIGANDYFIIFASAKNRPNRRGGESPHTNFRLSRAGEFLGLFSPELPRRLVSDLGGDYPEQRNDHSFGLRSSGGYSYFSAPTPGEENSDDSILEILSKPILSAPRGFYDKAFLLSLSSEEEGAIVRYTVDLSEPTMENGIEYKEPISVARRLTIRAATFKPGFLPSETVTHSYLYRLSSSRRSLPVLSLVTDRSNLFGASGIMETNPRNTSKRGRSWERPVSVEYFLPDGSTGFQIDCGLRIQGGNYVRGRYNPSGSLPFSKYSFRLYFRGDYGESELTYPIIPRSPADQYKQIVLRAGMNDHSNPFVVDELVRRLSADMGQVSAQGTLVNLYVNGAYEGYYNPTERIDEDFLDTWQGGNGDYDIIAQFGEVRAGDTVEWDRLKEMLGRDLSLPENYNQASQVLQIDSFIDYLILNIYVGTRDWPHNNWRAARERVPGAQWRFYVWDAEWSFFNQGGSINHNTLTSELGVNQDIARFYQSLSQNTSFRTRFADRVHRHFFGEGALTDKNVRNRFEELRGGMARVLPNMAGNISSTWIPRRRGIIFDHLADEGLFLEDNVPKFSHEPGSVRVPAVTLETGDGEIYYTLDGSDPFVPESASGNRTKLVPARATKYVLVPTDASVSSDWRRADRGFEPTGWKNGRGGVGYDEAQTYRTHIGIDVNEEMNDKNTSVYVRIPFTVREGVLEGVNLLNLRVKYDDGFVAYLNGIRVAEANGPATLRWNASASGDHSDAAAVSYQNFKISDHLGRLQEGANVLAIQGLNIQLTSSDFLLDALLEVGVVESGKVADGAIRYSDEIGVSQVTHIKARSLANGRWSAASEGVFYPGGLTSSVKFSEIMYHAPGGDEFEFIELTNFGPVTVDLSQYSLSGVSFSFPFGSFLDPGESLVLASDQKPLAFAERYPAITVWGHYGGSLSNSGEALVLKDPQGRYVSGIRYGDGGVWPEEADGGGYSLELISSEEKSSIPSNWWASQQAGGSPGIVQSFQTEANIVISELMAANRTAVELETGGFPDWVEIENRGQTRIALSGYRLKDESGGAGFIFDDNASLEPGERLVIWQAVSGLTVPGLPFGLDRNGDSLVLLDAAGRRIDGVSFGRQLDDYSLIRTEKDLWSLAEPSPGVDNREAATAPLSSVRINEMMANPLPGEPDWVELYNTNATLPVALNGAHFQVNDFPVSFGQNSFLGASGYGVFYFDGQTRAESLQFKLSAAGGELVLLNAQGDSVDRIEFEAQVENTSIGRLPDGVGTFRTFSINASPGQENYDVIVSQLRINEVMARNQSLRYSGVEGTPDWIEIANHSAAAMDIGGIRIRVSGKDEWIVPEGMRLPAGGLLVLWCDGEGLIERTALKGFNLGRSLGGGADLIELFDSEGRLLDQIEYGPQVPDRSIGWTGGRWELLLEVSPGAVNSQGSPLGVATDLRINEWRGGGDGDDWLELFNLGDLPVSLRGLYLSDDPSLAGKIKHQIAPLSFVDSKAWVLFQADGEPQRGADHLSFKLDAQGETLRLYSTRLNVIDEIQLALTESGVGSVGRLPDGGLRLVSFASTERTPAGPNFQSVPGLQINEVLAYALPPLEPAIEIYNHSGNRIDLSGWMLGWSATSLDQFRVPAGTMIQPGAFHVLYEGEWDGGSGEMLDLLRIGESEAVYLSEIDSEGNATGRRAVMPVDKSSVGQSVGSIGAGSNIEYGRLFQPTFGASVPDSVEVFRMGLGVINSLPWVGPVVVNEIFYDGERAVNGGGASLDRFEYVALFNRSSDAVELSVSSDSEIGWRLAGGIDYTFQGDVALRAGGEIVLVNFDPSLDLSQKRAFQEAFALPSDALLVGPFMGRLGNDGDRLRLQRLDRLPSVANPNEGDLVWLEEDRVDYRTESPWPNILPEPNQALSRVDLEAYGNDPANWNYADARPGHSGGPAGPTVGDPMITGIELGDGKITLRVSIEAGRRYRVEYATNIDDAAWTELTMISGEGAALEIVDRTVSGEKRFYRIVGE
ncbi:lamin tail domain-containing protein [bacterium]|nr:lamin tail domain-containing protein [bacterium]